MITEPGIYTDLPAEDYFADPCPAPSLSQSIAKIMLDQSPQHARVEHPRLLGVAETDEDEGVEKYDKAKAIGNAAHALMIGRGKTLAVADFANWQTKDAKAFKAEAIEAGKEPILQKHFNAASVMVSSARRDLDLIGWNDAFTEGNGEAVLIWSEGEGEDKIWLRIMLDWLTPDRRTYYDFKTSGMSVAPHGVGYMLDDAGWDVQAAMAERGLAVLDPEGRGRRRYRFVAQENKRPFALLPVELSEHHLQFGRRKLAVAINLWRKSIKTGIWPGYPLQAVTPDIPPARENRWIEREMAMIDAGLWSIDDPIILGAAVERRATELMEPV
jgi:hypothetical protein